MITIQPTDSRAQVRSDVRRALDLLVQPGQVVELRIPSTRRGTQSGYYDDLDALARDAAALDGRVSGIYITLNPVRHELLARAKNRLKDYAKQTTSDRDILTRRWLPIDFDPVRPAGISATESERKAACARAEGAMSWMSQTLGWPLAIRADSGNGAHLLYRIDLPNDEASSALLERCLKALAFRFSDATVSVDLTTINAARIWKLYGTLACKGDTTADRPHRRSRVCGAPEDWQ